METWRNLEEEGKRNDFLFTSKDQKTLTINDIYRQPRFEQLRRGIEKKIAELFPDFPVDKNAIMRSSAVPSKSRCPSCQRY